MFPFSRFPVKVIIFEERADRSRIIEDRGRRIEKGGEFFYQLKRMKLKTRAIPYKYLRTDDRGRTYLFLYSDSPNSYEPMEITHANPANPSFKVIDEDMRLWMTMQTRKAYERFHKKSLIEKLMPIIMVAATGVVVAMIIYAGVGKMAEMSASLGSMAESLSTAANAFKDAANMLVTGRAAPPAPP